MKKIGLVVKEYSENTIVSSIKDSDACFVLKYSGLSSPDVTSLRRAFDGKKAKFLVVKNTVARRALKQVGLESIISKVEGPCGFVFIKDEPVEVSKAIFNFYKDHEKLVIEGGVFNNKVVEKKDIEFMSKLPSKDVLRAQVVCTLNSPIVGIVMVLNANLRKLVMCLEQIKQKKSS